MPNSLSHVFNIGPSIVGSILGDAYMQYRPTSANNPTSDANVLSQLPAWITGDASGKGRKAPDFGKNIWYGMFDPTITQVGDYLIGTLGTFFIASQDVPQPIIVVRCNHTVDITIPAPMNTGGKQSAYGGDLRGTEVDVAAAWPCSIVQGTKGEVGSTKLPGDVKMPWTTVLLPAIPGVTLRNNIILTTEDQTRYIASSCELTALGWRISAALATT